MKFEIRIISKCRGRLALRFFVIANCIIERGSISIKMKKINVELTEEEAKVVADYIFRKACRLADSNLTDSYCYPRLYSAYHKIDKAMGGK